MARRQPGWSVRTSVDRMVDEIGVTQALERGILEAAGHLRTTWTQVLKRQGSGRTYPADITFRTFGGRVVPVKREAVGEQNRTAAHTASAPGEPPATDSGVLSNSIARVEQSRARQRVGTPLAYARWLHFGVTDHPGGITIAPRPHGDIALEEARDGMRKLMRRATRRHLSSLPDPV